METLTIHEATGGNLTRPVDEPIRVLAGRWVHTALGDLVNLDRLTFIGWNRDEHDDRMTVVLGQDSLADKAPTVTLGWFTSERGAADAIRLLAEAINPKT